MKKAKWAKLAAATLTGLAAINMVVQSYAWEATTRYKATVTFDATKGFLRSGQTRTDWRKK